MSTLKSSAEDLTLNADGSGNDIKFQSNAVEKGSLTDGGVWIGSTFEPTGDTAAGDNAAIGYTAAEGLILTGQGSTSDITLKNDADATVFTVPTGTDDILFPDAAKAIWGDSSDLKIYHDGTDNSYITNTNAKTLNISSDTMNIGGDDLYIGNNTIVRQRGGQPQFYSQGYSNSASTCGIIGFQRGSHSVIGSWNGVDAGDYLGVINWAGANDAVDTWMGGCQIQGVAMETYTGSAGGSEFRFRTIDNGTTTMDTNMTIAHNGIISGDFNDTSDVNLKENIVDMGSATATIKALKPRIFDWKKVSKGTGVAGFIAQEVAETIPKAVVGRDWVEETFYEDGDEMPESASIGDVKVDGNQGKCLNATAILAYAVKTIQELEARIEVLENP
jgi:hypothetical protein